MYVIQTVYSTLKKSLKPRNFFLLYNQVPHGTPEKIDQLLNMLTPKFQEKLEITVLGVIPLDPTMDFWDSLIIREGTEILNTLKQMVDRI